MNEKHNQLRERTRRFLSELNLPISRFAASVGFDRSAYYKWQKGENVFSETKLQAIEKHISKFGF